MTDASLLTLDDCRRLIAGGRVAEGLAGLDELLAVTPGSAGLLHLKGVALHLLGRSPEAVVSFDQALAVEPRQASIHQNRVIALLALGRTNDAMLSAAEAIRLRPGNPQAFLNLAIAENQACRYAEAWETTAKGLDLAPEHPGLLANAAQLAIRAGNTALAETYLSRALAVAPDSPDIVYTAGALHQARQAYEEALRAFDRVLALHPGHQGAFIERASVLRALGRVDEARAHIRRGLAAAPGWMALRHQLALTELLAGNWTAAWPDFDLGLARTDAPQRPASMLWDGGDVSRKTLLILHEGSLADTIQFLRFLPFAAGRAGRVMFLCPQRLYPLLSRLDLFSDGTIVLVAEGTALPPHDAHVPLLSLVRLAGTPPDAIPRLAVGLALEEPRLARWAALGGRERPWRVGLGLFDGLEPAIEPGRGTVADHISALAPLADRACFVALQRPPGQEPQIPEGFAIAIPSADFETDRDFILDLSALILSLDIVVTSDNLVAHLAGLLGRPVWLLLDTVPDWRWGLAGELTDWYPTMRIFRASARNDWAGLFGRVALELDRLTDALADLGNLQQGNAVAETGSAGIAARALPMAAHAAAMMPANADFWNHLAALYDRLGNLADSSRALRFALDAAPDHVPSLVALAKAHFAAGQSKAALALVDRALQHDPAAASAYAARATILVGAKRVREAETVLRQALDIEPDNAALWSQLATTQSAGRRLRNAGDSWERALAIDPSHADAYSGLCANERAIGDIGIACWLGRRAVECDPRHVTAWCNLGRAEFDAGRTDEAATAFRSALELEPMNAAAHVGLGLALLGQGDLANGLRHHEARLLLPSNNVRRPSLPMWKGGDPTGLSLLLLAEGDMTDTLLFARYATWLKANGAARVTVACSSDLAHLLATVPGVDGVVAHDEPQPIADVMAYMASMPLLTGMTIEPIPAFERYLDADTMRAAQWADWLGERPGLRVGLALSGAGLRVVRKAPAFDPQALAPIAHVSGIRLIALGKADGDAASLMAGDSLPLEHPGPDFDNGPDRLADTAALIAGLDLVVTSDAIVAHLAGALGKPCWVILDAHADWRWLSGRSDSPWYPATRLFRRLGDEVEAAPFAGVFARLADALEKLVDGDRSQLAVTDMPEGVVTAPFDPIATYNAALVAYRARDDATATKLFGAVLKVPKLIPLALNMLGATALQAARNHRALVFLSGAARAGLNTPEMLTNYAIGLRRIGAIDEAIGKLDTIIAQAPTAEAYLTLANIYRDRCDFAPSLANYEAALTLKPDFAKAHRGVGNLMRDMRRPQEALAAFERARLLTPKDADLILDHAHAKLFAGDLVGGFRDYEYRWQSREAAEYRKVTEPRWNGETAAGRVLLIHGEQGFGDNIQFVRFVDEASRRVGRVVLEVRGPLTELMRRLETEKPVTVVEAGMSTGKCDFQIPMLSLPMAFGTTLDTIPPPARFRLDPDRVAAWRERLRGEGATIGLIWQGNPKARADVGRSPPFAALAPLFTLPDTRFVALQKTDGLDQLRRSPHADRIVTPGVALGDFAETAHAIAALDAVVSSCTATLHLAASLGVPVYGMLKFNADWRWLDERDTSPWYPSLRLFRQDRPHDWEPVVARIRAALAERMVSG